MLTHCDIHLYSVTLRLRTQYYTCSHWPAFVHTVLHLLSLTCTCSHNPTLAPIDQRLRTQSYNCSHCLKESSLLRQGADSVKWTGVHTSKLIHHSFSSRTSSCNNNQGLFWEHYLLWNNNPMEIRFILMTTSPTLTKTIFISITV